jgi:hypothetical protein
MLGFTANFEQFPVCVDLTPFARVVRQVQL